MGEETWEWDLRDLDVKPWEAELRSPLKRVCHCRYAAGSLTSHYSHCSVDLKITRSKGFSLFWF